jgi:hypothetical protein
MRFPSEDAEKSILWSSVQNMAGKLPAQSQQMYSLQQSQYHTQANAVPSQPKLNNWTKVSYERGRLTQDETEREAKHTKESEHWLNQISISNLEEETADQQQKANPENTPKPPLIYITHVKNIPPLTQLLKQIAKQQ